MSKIDDAIYLVWETYYTEWKLRLGGHLPAHAERKLKKGMAQDNRIGEFRAIAELCCARKFNPVDYIIANFEGLETEALQHVMPSDLTRPAAIRRFLDRETLVDGMWPVHQAMLLEMAQNLIPKMYNIVAGILADPHTPFPAWFRVLYLKPFHEKLCAYYGESAFRALRNDCRLRTYLRKLMPEAMQQLEQHTHSFHDTIFEDKP